MNILLWHVHGSWTTAFVQGGHDYFVPVTPDRGPDGLGRARTWQWPASVREISPKQLASAEIDLVILQRPRELDLVRDWAGRRPGRELPAIYVEHNTPDASPVGQRHPLADQSHIPIAHVTHFNKLYWDNGTAPTTVVEHGVPDPGPLYQGDLPHAGVVINDPLRRGRVVGADLLNSFAEVGPVDLFGMRVNDFVQALQPKSDRITPYEDESTQLHMHRQLARRRLYLHPMRWTSLGLSLIEAMLLGMPVVVLAGTEAVDVIDSSCGVISTEVDRLRAAMRTYLNEPEAARLAGKAARSIALSRFGLDRFLNDWDALLESMTA